MNIQIKTKQTQITNQKVFIQSRTRFCLIKTQMPHFDQNVFGQSKDP